MKKLVFLALFISALLGPAMANSNVLAPDFVITDERIFLTVDAHMDAHSVKTELLTASGGVLGTVISQPGATVSFPLSDAASKVRSTYYCDSGNYVITIEVII